MRIIVTIFSVVIAGLLFWSINFWGPIAQVILAFLAPLSWCVMGYVHGYLESQEDDNTYDEE